MTETSGVNFNTENISDRGGESEKASTNPLPGPSEVDMEISKVRKPGRRGRKPAKVDVRVKLERSRQSARECRARKKLRYQYLEELIASRERAIHVLRRELEQYWKHCQEIEKGHIPNEVLQLADKTSQAL